MPDLKLPIELWINRRGILLDVEDFKKKSTEEVIGILEKKVSATIKCYQAIFDKKYLFLETLSAPSTTLLTN
ncbi:hypothetical protein C8Q72DRAFT_889681 [Fomitopsis betulina]|nr:hypothetical protein C8Q72DRAFT_889681 [Fomitopsis betulina]